jgi:hypothetical protein
VRPVTIANEAELTKEVIRIAHDYGWLVCRFHRLPVPRAGRTEWRTAVGADGKGFPDLTLVRERIVYAELKMKGRYAKPEQRTWIAQLKRAGAEVYVWRDDDLPELERVLKVVLEPRRLARLLLNTPEDSDLGVTVSEYARSVALMAAR